MSRANPQSNMTGVLIEGESWTQTCTQGEHHVKMEAEIELMLLKAKERQRLPANPQKLGDGPETDRCAVFRRSQPC